MRAIDADALIHELNNSHYPGAPYVDAGISIAIGKVCDAPTIEPEPQWIPVSERLPDKIGPYLITKYNDDVIPYYYDGKDLSKKFWKSYIKAWMPLPEPYREEGGQE